MHRHYPPFFFVAVLLVCTIAHAHAPAPAKPIEWDEAKLAGISRAMETKIAEHQIAGAVTLVATRDRIVHHEAVGHADIAADKQMAKDSLFWIASMTKPMTATCFMMLVDEGKVAVDDPVSKYIPAFKDVKLNGQSPKREITIRDLMTHTSGIGEATRNQATGRSLEELTNLIAATPLKFEPGERWNYGSGLSVVARIIEIVSGKSYGDFIQTRLFDPVGMKDTTFNISPQQAPRLARTYKQSADGKSLEVTPTRYAPEADGQQHIPNPSGGLFSCTADLARFYQMVLSGGHIDGKRILSEKAVKQMSSLAHDENIKTGFTAGNGWGLGWILTREPQGTTATISPGTFGHGGAFGTQGWIDPVRGHIYIMLVSRSGFPNGDDSVVRKAFHEAVFEAIVKPVPVPAAAPVK